MPSVISHAAVGTALKISFGPKGIPSSLLPLAIACSVVPDADSIGFYLGIPYGHFLAHRGFFHSPFLALILSFLCMVLLFRGVQPFSRLWFSVWILLILATASHGVLDAFTN